MATLSSMFRNAGTDSTRSTVARRGTKLFSYILAVGFCPVLAIGPAMAGTNGTSSTRMHAPSVASGSRPAPVEPALTIRGLSLAEWTQRFWNRFMSIPANVSPATDKTGIHCGINQSGPVWFLGAPIGTTNTLSCTIPADKVILAPAITFLNDYPCPDPSFEPGPGQTLQDFLVQGVTPIIDSFSATAVLDGKPIKLRRVTAGLQSFTGAKDIAPSLDACVTGSPQLGVADGQYAVIAPLSPGLHILHVHLESPLFGSSDNTFRLTIK